MKENQFFLRKNHHKNNAIEGLRLLCLHYTIPTQLFSYYSSYATVIKLIPPILSPFYYPKLPTTYYYLHPTNPNLPSPLHNSHNVISFKNTKRQTYSSEKPFFLKEITTEIILPCQGQSYRKFERKQNFPEKGPWQSNLIQGLR